MTVAPAVPGENAKMRVMERVKQWFEQHTPAVPWPSNTRWQGTSPAVRSTALDLTHARLDFTAREVEESLRRLQAEVEVLTGGMANPPVAPPEEEDVGQRGNAAG